VRRAVVHHQGFDAVEAREDAWQGGEGLRQVPLLVVARDLNDEAHVGESVSCGSTESQIERRRRARARAGARVRPSGGRRPNQNWMTTGRSPSPCHPRTPRLLPKKKIDNT